MDIQVNKIASKISFVANSSAQLELPKAGYITDILMKLKLNVTGAAMVVEAEDAIFRLIKSAVIKASGTHNYLDVVDGRQIKFMNAFQYTESLLENSLPAASTTADVVAMIPIHLGLDPTNLFDKSIIIPAHDMSNPIIQINWGAESDLGTGYTINSGEIELTIHQILIDEKSETRESVFPRIVEMRMNPEILNVISTYTNLGLTKDCPTRHNLYETLLIVLDSSGNRVNTDISEFGIKIAKQNKTPFNIPFDHLLSDNQRYYDLANRQTGVAMFRWANISGDKYGYDAKLDQTGDIQMGFSVDVSGGKILILHKRLAM